MTTLDLLASLINKCKEHPEVMFQNVFIRFPTDFNDLVGIEETDDDGVVDDSLVLRFDGYSVYIEPKTMASGLSAIEPATWPDRKGYAVQRNT